MRFRFFLLLLLCLSLFLRMYNLSSIPSMLLEKEMRVGIATEMLLRSNTPDSLSLFAHKKSLIDTSDIAPLPLLTTAPFVKTLGLNEWSVRLPSVLFGTLSILVFFFVCQESSRFLSQKTKDKETFLSNRALAFFPFLSSIFLALSPWHIQVSRVDAGINLGLTFILLGVYFLLKRKRLSILSAILLILALYADFSFLIPIILLFLVTLVFLKNKPDKLTFVKGLFLGLILLFPLLLPSIHSVIRIDDTTTYFLSLHESLSQKRIEYSMQTPLSKILFHPSIENGKLFVSHFLSYVEPHQLFSQWVHNRNYLSPFSGLFYPQELIFFLSGVVLLLKHNRFRLVVFLIVLLLVVLPLAVTQSTPDPLRAVAILPLVLGISVCGVMSLSEKVSQRFRTPAVAGIGLVSVYFVARFLLTYHIDYPALHTDYPQEYKQALLYRMANFPFDKETIISDTTFGKNTYLTLLFLRPSLAKNVTTTNSQSEILKMYHYTFVSEPSKNYTRQTIYIQPTQSVPENAHILFTSSSRVKKFRISVFTHE